MKLENLISQKSKIKYQIFPIKLIVHGAIHEVGKARCILSFIYSYVWETIIYASANKRKVRVCVCETRGIDRIFLTTVANVMKSRLVTKQWDSRLNLKYYIWLFAMTGNENIFQKNILYLNKIF
jgi:hypothetical protein